jgi:photosystem II stability/assembly factor-like uncharacterized protein
MSALHAAIGTTGQATWFTRDGGDNWERTPPDAGLYVESRVRSLATHPARRGEFHAGTDSGVYRWRESERKWTHLSPEFSAVCSWAVAQSPADPDLIFAGTGASAAVPDAALYRSRDGGRSWQKLDLGNRKDAPNPIHNFVERPRVTSIAFDPNDANIVWVGIEIGGIHKSVDGGESWTRMQGLPSEDIHGLLVLGRNRGTVLATTNRGLVRSSDAGASWALVAVDTPRPFMRGIAPISSEPGSLLMTNGSGAPGAWGKLFRSADDGESWAEVALPGKTNSTMWCIAIHPSAPSEVLACSVLGQIFRSHDAGRSWEKLERELNEIRSVAWIPT